MTGAYVGTPGRAPVGGPATTKVPASLSGTGIIINEVRNDSSAANLDWIEIVYHGVPGTANAINIDGYELNIVTEADLDADGEFKDANKQPKAEVTVVNFPKYKLQAGEYLVIYNRDPGDTVLAGGVIAQDVIDGKQVNKGASHVYFVADQTDADQNLVPSEIFPVTKCSFLFSELRPIRTTNPMRLKISPVTVSSQCVRVGEERRVLMTITL